MLSMRLPRIILKSADDLFCKIVDTNYKILTIFVLGSVENIVQYFFECYHKPSDYPTGGLL
jgi:hypothetical protein